MDNRERERVRKTIIKYTFLFEQNLRATVDLHRPKVYSYADVIAIAIDQLKGYAAHYDDLAATRVLKREKKIA
jgi:hypothetical protein